MRRSLVLRQMVAEILHRIVVEQASLSTVLPERVVSLEPRERAWVQALVYTTLRWYPRLEGWSRLLLQRPLPRRDAMVRILVLQGLAELHHFGTPDHAVIAETAELARVLRRPRAVGLVNAVLRRSRREADLLTSKLDSQPETRWACPLWWIEMLRSAWPDEWENLLAAALEQAPLTLRVNRCQGTRAALLDEWMAAGWHAEPHPWVSSAIHLATAVDVEQIPGFATGRVTVQDAAAQWAAELLDVEPGMRVLDACAAPGGKTSHLLEVTGGNLELTALDIDPVRLRKIESHLQRLQWSAVLREGDLLDPDRWWDGRPFDRILLDVPCSATGTLRRHPDLKVLRRAEDIPRLAALQERLLEQAAHLLRPGGKLLYVTCSLLPQENEVVVGGWLARRPDFTEEILAFAGGCARRVGRATIMGRAGMDGFYYALLQRHAYS